MCHKIECLRFLVRCEFFSVVVFIVERESERARARGREKGGWVLCVDVYVCVSKCVCVYDVCRCWYVQEGSYGLASLSAVRVMGLVCALRVTNCPLVVSF